MHTREPTRHMPFADLATLHDLAMRSEALADRLQELALVPKAAKTGRRFSAIEVAQLTGLSRRTLFNRLNNPDFPQGERIGATHKRMWTLAEIHKMVQIEGRTSGHTSVTEKPVVLAVSNLQRGAGKTTASVHLAQYLAMRGYRILLIDLDPQGAATRFLGIDATAHPPVHARPHTLEAAICPTYWHGLDIVPSTPKGRSAESVIAGRAMAVEGGLEIARKTGLFYPRSYFYLKTEIDELAKTYDAVVLDTAPMYDLCAMNGLCAADGLIVPFLPTGVGTGIAMRFLQSLKQVTEAFNEELKERRLAEKRWSFLRLLPNCFVHNNAYQAMILDHIRREVGTFTTFDCLGDSRLIRTLGAEMKTAYDIERHQDRREFERTIDNLNNINAEIEELIQSASLVHRR